MKNPTSAPKGAQYILLLGLGFAVFWRLPSRHFCISMIGVDDISWGEGFSNGALDRRSGKLTKVHGFFILRFYHDASF